MLYEIIEVQVHDKIDRLVKRTDGEIVSFIPMVEENSDYQAYLKWVEENNG